MDKQSRKSLTIIHYNDVYELRGTDKEICGGADRFCYLVNKFREEHDALVLFSGDLWNPSKLSMSKRGEQMVKVVNYIDTKAACVGNHDLDLGDDQAKYLTSKCNFPWLLSNVKFIDGTSLADSQDYAIIDHKGMKIGLIGLAEYDWVVTLAHFDPDELNFVNPVVCGDKLAIKLRKECVKKATNSNVITSSH